MKYVVGFLFDDEDRVLLLLKRPGISYVSDCWNGVGGKIEIGETPNGAMRREALEEANIELPEDVRWMPFHYERHLSGNEFYFYTTCVKRYSQCVRSIETVNLDEPVVWFCRTEVGNKTNSLSTGGIPKNMVPNLSYLLPMARHWLAHPTERYLEG